MGTNALGAHGNLPLPSEVCHALSLQRSAFFSAYFFSAVAFTNQLMVELKGFSQRDTQLAETAKRKCPCFKINRKTFTTTPIIISLVMMTSDFSHDKIDTALGIYYWRVSGSFFFFFFLYYMETSAVLF